MNPTVTAISEENDVYKFTMSETNVSLANALRRTILSDVPTLAFYTETYESNHCNIQVNTSRLHNEIIKQRLSCIPIHMKELDILPGKYILDVDVTNDTEVMMFITTEDFRIRNKESGSLLTKDEMRKIFPPCQRTNAYIDFVRLRGKIAESIPGEQLKLTAEFSVHTAKDNSMYNVVSKCAYGNTPDVSKIASIWQEQEDKLRSEETAQSDIDFQKRNFYLLDAQRHFVSDSFDFVIQTLGVYENKEIVKKACGILVDSLIKLMTHIESDTVPILNSETTMDFCYDIILENEDYTLGKVLEYLLYEKYYTKEQIFTFCGFKKFHPHNADSTLRIAYVQTADKHTVKQHLFAVCSDAKDIFTKMSALF